MTLADSRACHRCISAQTRLPHLTGAQVRAAAWQWTASKRIAQTHLHVTLAHLAVNLAERAAARVGIYASPIGVIEPIEEFAAKLETMLLPDGEVLEQRQVPVLETRIVDQRIPGLGFGERACSRGC